MDKYKITIPHFYYLQFEDLENNKKMKIYIDFRDKYKEISTSLITAWDLPFENELIDTETKDRIFTYVYDYLIGEFGKQHVINRNKKYSNYQFFLKYPLYVISSKLKKLKKLERR